MVNTLKSILVSDRGKYVMYYGYVILSSVESAYE